MSESRETEVLMAKRNIHRIDRVLEILLKTAENVDNIVFKELLEVKLSLISSFDINSIS